jgi:hypothetical protein
MVRAGTCQVTEKAAYRRSRSAVLRRYACVQRLSSSYLINSLSVGVGTPMCHQHMDAWRATSRRAFDETACSTVNAVPGDGVRSFPCAGQGRPVLQLPPFDSPCARSVSFAWYPPHGLGGDILLKCNFHLLDVPLKVGRGRRNQAAIKGVLEEIKRTFEQGTSPGLIPVGIRQARDLADRARKAHMTHPFPLLGRVANPCFRRLLQSALRSSVACHRYSYPVRR